MTMRRIRALIEKDLRLHWKGILAAHGGVLAMATLATALREPPQQGDPTLSFVGNLNFLCALLWGEWFVSQEKTKGSFAWLRTLPIGARELCISKFAVSGLCVTSLWTVSSVVFLRSQFLTARATWPVVLLALALFGATVVASRMLFRQKLGQVLPLLVALPFILTAFVAERYGVLTDALAFWQTLGGKLAVACLLAAAYAGICALTIRLVAAAETRRLVE